MTKTEERGYAAREALRLERLASEYRQMGFPALARFCRENARAALRWASRPEPLPLSRGIT